MLKFNKYQKNILLAIIFLSAAAIISTTALNAFLKNLFIKKHTQGIEALAGSVARNISSAMSINDEYSIRMFCYDICSMEDVSSCSILDESGKVIAENNDEEKWI